MSDGCQIGVRVGIPIRDGRTLRVRDGRQMGVRWVSDVCHIGDRVGIPIRDGRTLRVRAWVRGFARVRTVARARVRVTTKL